MRVTDSAAFAAIRKQVTRARADYATAQEQASTGLRVQRPSDDPVAAAAARRESSRKALADAGSKATDHATMELEGSDAALGDVFDGLTRARELALESSSSTVSEENRRTAAIEVRKIYEQMVTLGNTNVAGRYVFAGYSDKTAPFQEDGQFIGDDSTKEVQAMPGMRTAASISGSTVFGTGLSDNLFSTLDSLATALEQNDVEAVRATFTALDSNEDRVLSARSQVGAMMDSVSVTQAIADRYSYRSEVEIARLTEIDEISSATNLVQAKSALESALAIAQQIPVGNLAGGK